MQDQFKKVCSGLLGWAIIFIFLSSLAAGCLVQYGEPSSQLGEYRFIYRQYYTGPIIRSVPIWIDKNFSVQDLADIEKAIGQWNFALNGYIELHVVDTAFDMEPDKIEEQMRGGGWLFMKIDSSSGIIPAQDEPGYHTVGFVDQIGGQYLYLVRDLIRPNGVFGITLHEIGHLLGSPHIGNHLMYPYYSQAGFQCIDWVSIQAVAQYQGLPAKRLNYCVDSNGEKAQVAEDEICPN